MFFSNICLFPVIITDGTSTPAKQHPHARKLDESEVLIVSPSFGNNQDANSEIDQNDSHINTEDSLIGNNSNDNNLLDTSHVSVVTVGEEQVKVKDSSNNTHKELHMIPDSISDLSNISINNDSGDDLNISSRSYTKHNNKLNGDIHYNNSREDVSIIVNKKKTKPRISPDSSVGSMDGSRTHSESGSLRSHANSTPPATKLLDRSDAESIATTVSHDSNIGDDDQQVQLRRAVEQTKEQKEEQQMHKRTPRSKEEMHLNNLKKKTRKRTRKFEIDGVQVTTTTSKVIYGDDENNRLYNDHIFRKQELRELKLLQKQEKKQFYDLQSKEHVAREQQDKKFEQERIALERTYEADMDVLARQHRQSVEKYEQQQESELKNTSKKIRGEQERDLKIVSLRKKCHSIYLVIFDIIFFSSVIV